MTKMDNYCRACLSKYEEPDVLLQYTEENRRLFVYSTGLQVKRNDAFTFQLCKICYDTMKSMCKFKKNCRAADKKIKSFLAMKDVEGEEELEFGIFLKKYQEPIMLKLPSLGGNTPAHGQSSDEDNESTCTSIQNFMTNMIGEDEIPDTEAQIIKEVIEEEADIMEDSLDSHWLGDDMSIQSIFPLEASYNEFSTQDPQNGPEYLSEETVPQEQFPPVKKEIENPDDSVFATPNVINIKTPIDNTTDGCFIDKKLEDALKDENNQEFSLDYLLGPQCSPVLGNPNASRVSTPTIHNILFGDKVHNKDANKLRVSTMVSEKCHTKLSNAFDTVELSASDTFNEKSISLEGMLYVKKYQKIDEGDECTIDAFLNEQKFLVDDTNNEPVFKHENVLPIDDQELTELLQTCDEEEELNESKHSGIPDQSGDVLDKTLLSPIENKYCITNFYCKMCNKQFAGLPALKAHFSRYHKVKISNAPKKIRRGNGKICDYCGKSCKNLGNLRRHLDKHEKPSAEFKCDTCTLSFRTKQGLKQHNATHVATAPTKAKPAPRPDRKYICTVCGAVCTTSSNYTLHMKRHDKIYTSHCDVCGRGFYRQSELTTHLRSHTGERPYKCLYCDSSFNRRDILNRHMKQHTNEKPFECVFCKWKFPKQYDLIRHHRVVHMKSKKD